MSARIFHVTTAHAADDMRIYWKEAVALRRAGYDVTIVAPNTGKVLERGISLITVPKRARSGRFIRGSIDVLVELRRERPDLAHFHDPELLPAAYIAKRFLGIHVIYDAHEDLPKQILVKDYLPPWLRPTLAWLMGKALSFVEERSDAVVVANPTNVSAFKNPRTTLVQNYPWRDDYPRTVKRERGGPAIYIGAISELRGLREMIAAVEQSIASRLVLAGNVGSDVADIMEDSSERIEYRGVLPPDEVPSILAEASVGLVLLHPVTHYMANQATKLYEYMAAGIPVVASNFPLWSAELESDGVGFFVDPLDVTAITEALDWIEQNPDAAIAMGRRGREVFEARYSFDAESTQLVELVQQILPFVSDHERPEESQ